MHIRQAAVDAVVAEGQLLVIDAKQAEDGRVDVVAISWILDGFVAPFVGRAEADSSLDAAARKPVSEPERIVIASFASLAAWCRTGWPRRTGRVARLVSRAEDGVAILLS